MSNIREGLRVISVAVPALMKSHIDRKIATERHGRKSDWMRKVLLDQLESSIPPEDFLLIRAEIEIMIENRH